MLGIRSTKTVLDFYLDDSGIMLFTPYREVRKILLTRSQAKLSVNQLELGEQSRQPSADKAFE